MIAVLTPLLYSLGPAALVLVMAVVFAESGLLVGYGPRLFSPAHADRAHAFFETHGPKAVILARFIPVAALSVVPAGLAYLRNRSTSSARTAEPRPVLEEV